MKSSTLVEPDLVGREQELKELMRYLESAFNGKGNTVFITGEAGSGKTRISRKFLNEARNKGAAIMAGWCLAETSTPYFPFIEAFNTYYTAFTEEEQTTSIQMPEVQLSLGAPAQMGTSELEITSWLTGPKPAEPLGKAFVISPQVWKDQAFAAVAKTLHVIASQGPLILFIEDLHWADSASLAMLHYVTRAIHNSERILVLATFRSDELTADAEGHPHPLTETLRNMKREDIFTEINLPNLRQPDVLKMAENMIGGSLNEELTEKLIAESRGNPLFIVESLRMLSERRSIVQEEGKWRLAVNKFGIPSKIKDIILRRLSILKYPQRRLLDAASVIGEEFDAELLSVVLGQDILEVLETLNVISQSTSLVFFEGNCYRFDHARSRETLYEELSPPLKRGYHARIAEKLESASVSLPPGNLAYHYVESGNKEKAVEYALAAAKDELARWSNSQAIKHFTYVLKNISDGHVEEKQTALEGLGDAYAANSMYADAIKVFNELASCQTGSDRLRAIRKAMDAAFLKGDKPALLLEYSRKAEELAVYDRLEMARVLNNRGRAFGWTGHSNAKMDLADYDAALKVFEEENSLPDVAEALWRSGVVCTLFDELREKGLSELLRSVAIFRELGDVRGEMEATLHVGIGFATSSLNPEARREWSNVLKLGEKLDIFVELAQASAFLSYGFEYDYNFEEAISLTLRALSYSQKTDASWLSGLLYAYLIRQYSKLGDLKTADEYFDTLSKLSPEILSHFMNVNEINIAYGVYFAAKGQIERSNQIFEEIFANSKAFPVVPNLKTNVRGNFAWVLEMQGKTLEARANWKRIQELFKQVEKRFGHTNFQANLLTQRRVQVGEEFELRLDLINVARRPGILVRIECPVPSEFKITALPSFCILKNGNFEIKNKSINPFQVETIKLKLKATKAGDINLNLNVIYIDDLGETRTSKPNPITISIQPAKPKYKVLPGRILTGTDELDSLLYGGIPEHYAVALTSPSTDERELLIKKFLEIGAKTGVIFNIASEATNARTLAEKYPSNFYLFICNPQADVIVPNQPHIFKLKGIENLTDIDIALTKAFRTVCPSPAGARRICIEIVSDVLLMHQVVNTRRWLSAQLPILKSKGFTVLAVVDPKMHPPEELQAVLSLFNGEIRVIEKETPDGIKQMLKVRKLVNQTYSDIEVALNKVNLVTPK